MKKNRCYEYLSCEKRDCIMFHKDDNDQTPCWETKGTLCFDKRIDSHIQSGHKKIFFCENCLYRFYMLDEQLPRIAVRRAGQVLAER